MIDYDKLRTTTDKTRRLMYAQEELAKFTGGESPYLSDVYLRLEEGGQSLLIALDEQEKREMRPGGSPFKWKILVRRDEWGNIPQPGDVITRTVPINRKNRDHMPVRAGDFNNALVRGSYSDDFELKNEYIVDDKGCIECQFQDAGYFLFNWGVHHKTNRGMCNKKEYSSEPCKSPSGADLHVHYWRYSEVDAVDYESLSKRVADKTKKRGIEK